MKYVLIGDIHHKGADLFNNFEDSDHGLNIYLDESRFGTQYKTIIIHGALVGKSDLGKTEDSKDLYFRLQNEKDYLANFDCMEQQDYKIMIRGHDHKLNQVLFFQNSQKTPAVYIPKANKIYRLEREQRYIINPRVLYKGQFAIIDSDFPNEDVPVITFHNFNL